MWVTGFGGEATTLPEWQEFLEDACQDGPVLLWEGHLSLWQGWLQWPLQVKGEVSFAQPLG